ncbi:DUF2075 domain-containing protein [Noviherbaspirillum sp. ST9]|uniref:DUF2075 domain-containing protein n=1 Tax=Noviherbaspirillum sp. ST9 TaxID=3401606 RepID=UPI003B58964D
MGVRAFYTATVCDFLQESVDSIVGKISQQHCQDIVQLQMGAWQREIELLKECLPPFEGGHILIELQIPRMGRRADAVLIYQNIIYVMEFKVGAKAYHSHDLRQTHGYAIDLHHFHEGSHNKTIVPLLVATEAPAYQLALSQPVDHVHSPLRVSAKTLQEALTHCVRTIREPAPIDFQYWFESAYKPTPTIVEAAQALYANHDVADIARNDAGAHNLHVTSSAILDIVHRAREEKQKVICFVTGVPGAGKTLVGLNIATTSVNIDDDEHAVFLSGNGPLVDVLTEALARDAKDRNSNASKEVELRKAAARIQNIHKFRDEALLNPGKAPPERVVIFDEAQRAWDAESTAKFMVQKRGQRSFDQSEPEFLISVMNRHPDWCVIIALIGGGQEINTGEAGLKGWIDAIRSRFNNWHVYYSDKLKQAEYAGGDVEINGIQHARSRVAMHLATSMRSFKAERLSHMIHYLIENQPDRAAACYASFRSRFPIVVTRDIKKARTWIKDRARANETKGVIASSGGARLKPDGIFVKNKISAADWFLNEPEDVRSCHFLEDVATEFDIQGLELDWCLIGWDADFRYNQGAFEHWKFTGSSWKQRNRSAQKRYLENAYRVLLTRARQGMAIFVPRGELEDPTRPPQHYDETYSYLIRCGVQALES